MGGGTDVDAAFAWQRDRIGGGDVVVLRASGADGYNGYLHDEIGGVDSVETLLVDSAALAAEPYVTWSLDHAEAIFLAGGDQSVYLAAWGDSPVAAALTAAWQRGAVVGGTSAGCAVLGEIVFSAEQGTVYSDEALADPYGPYMTLTRDFVEIPLLAGVVTDTHFAARDRMGRLLAFAARATADGWATTPIGVGVDEETALVVGDDGVATVLGSGSVYVIAPSRPPAACAPGVPLAWADVDLHELVDGDTIVLPAGTTTVAPRPLSAAGGLLDPADPY
jgi:cyanophycinase